MHYIVALSAFTPTPEFNILRERATNHSAKIVNHNHFYNKPLKTKKTMKTYKGFNPDMTCRRFQYKVGENYEHKGKINICESGFHSCENPMDVLGYYAPSTTNGITRYCETEADGEMRSDDSKICSSKLHIKAEIGLSGLITAGVKFILDKVKWKDSPATNTGDYSAATNTGNWSAATNTGD